MTNEHTDLSNLKSGIFGHEEKGKWSEPNQIQSYRRPFWFSKSVAENEDGALTHITVLVLYCIVYTSSVIKEKESNNTTSLERFLTT